MPVLFGKGVNKGISFGIARDAYQKVFLKSSPSLGTLSPGPAQYKIDRELGKGTSKFTMRLKTAIPESNYTKKIVPGPGSYNILACINEKGKFMYAKFKNSGAVVFSPPSSVRFHEKSKGVSDIFFRTPWTGAWTV